MPQITGRVYDVGLDGSRGTMWLSAGFRSGALGVVAPRRVSWPIIDGDLPADVVVESGPAVLEIDVGVDARDSWNVVVPDGDVTLRELIASVQEWTPAELGEFAALKAAAVAAAAAAEDAASRAAADAATVASAAQDMSAQVAAAEGHASSTEADRVAVAGDRVVVEGLASQVGSDAGQVAADRLAVAGDRGVVESARSDTLEARDAAEGHASVAEQWATAFDVTASSSTLAPGSQATVTVTGDGPAYQLAFGVPQGEQGPRGEPGENGSAAWADITGKPAEFPPSAHEHTVSDVSGLQAALDGKASTSHSHSWSSITSKPTTFTPASHSHSTADVSGLDSALAGKAATSHTHSMSQVTGLDTALAGKASTSHTHTPASLGAVARSGTATTVWAGTAAQYAALADATKNAAGFIAVITD